MPEFKIAENCQQRSLREGQMEAHHEQHGVFKILKITDPQHSSIRLATPHLTLQVEKQSHQTSGETHPPNHRPKGAQCKGRLQFCEHNVVEGTSTDFNTR